MSARLLIPSSRVVALSVFSHIADGPHDHEMSSENTQAPAAIPAPKPPSDVEKEDKAKPGAHWKLNEEHVLPKNNIPLVFTGLMACVFLAALDQVCAKSLL